jgi:competence protein ComEC
MLSRERLWQRVCGAELWPLAWAMAAACAVPWLVPERWNGEVSLYWIFGGCLLVGASMALLRFKHGKVVPLALLLAGIAFLGLRHQALWESGLPTGFQEIQGVISAPWRTQGDRRSSRITLVRPESLKGCEIPLGLPLEGTPAPEPGTPVRFRGELRAVDPAPVFIAERPLWRARSDEAPRRIFLRSAQIMEVLGPAKPSLVLRMQTFFQHRFEALPLPEGTARDLWGALTLGIPPAKEEVFSAFAESGTIHTLVVSGLQVTLIMVALEALWRRSLKRGSGVASAVSGLLYCLIVGFSAPVWRGLLMGLAWALGRGQGWKLPPVLTLHLSLLLWLLTHPAAGCEPGFLLAWWALLGLLWGAEPLAGLLSPWLGRKALAFSYFLAPWLATLPLLALLHGGAPLWGVAANLLILPLVTLLTPICLGLTLLPIPGLVTWVGWLLTWTGDRLVPLFARIVPLGTGYLWPWILLALAWIWLGQRHAGLKRTRSLTLAIVGASAGLMIVRGTGAAPATLSLEAVDVGQGDALILRVPDGSATVIDTGPSPWAARRLVRVLSRRGVREPVNLVVTHPHGDHAGGWSTMARLWPFESVYIPGTAIPIERWTAVVPQPVFQTAQPLLRGNFWRTGEAECAVQWPPKPFDLEDLNMLSLVLRVRWRDRELWLMGDAQDIQERDLMDLGEPGGFSGFRLLKAGHHGSRNASDPQWIRALQPGLTFITAGRANTFGFPHGETMDTLRNAGCGSIWVAGPSFGVRAEAVARGWSISTGSGATFRP